MFERYTERARRVIFFARYECSQLGSMTIETEHLLLGLLREDKNLTSRFLPDPFAIDSIREAIEARVTIREKVSTSIDLPLTEESKHILKHAEEEAKRLNHQLVGTEHLLLGILHEEKCLAARVLAEKGLHLQAVRDEIEKSVQPSGEFARSSLRDSNMLLDPRRRGNVFQVPDESTAGRIAVAVWAPIYGAAAIRMQEPLRIERNRFFSWYVMGSESESNPDALFALVHSPDGRVLSMGRKSEGPEPQQSDPIGSNPGFSWFSRMPMPSAEVVPDDITAKRIAEAVWFPRYCTAGGDLATAGEATLTHGVWIVEGPHARNNVISTLSAFILKKDGKILIVNQEPPDA